MSHNTMPYPEALCNDAHKVEQVSGVSDMFGCPRFILPPMERGQRNPINRS